MKLTTNYIVALCLIQSTCLQVTGFVNPKTHQHLALKTENQSRSNAFSRESPQIVVQVSSSASEEVSRKVKKTKKKTIKDLREEGGMFTVNTPIGALNPFALYYGLLSLFLGIPWFIALKTCQLMYWVTRGKVDKKVRFSRKFCRL